MNIDNLPFTTDGGRHTIKTTRLKRRLSKFVDTQTLSYLSYDSQSRAVKFILELLDKVDTNRLNTSIESYMEFGKSYIENIEFLLDPVRNGPSKLPHFVEGDETSEIITPVNSSSAVSYMNDTWVDEYLDDQVLTIISHDSYELPYDITYDGLIRFEHDEPSHILIGINVPALVAKYIHWLSVVDANDEKDYIAFVKREVLKTRYRDLVDIYMFSLIRGVFRELEPVNVRRNTHVPMSAIKYAVEEIKELVHSVKNNTISLSSFMNTMFLVNDSVISRYERLDNTAKISSITKFTPIRLIKVLPVLDIVTHILGSSDKVFRNNKGIITQLRREYRILSRSKWKNHIHDPLAEAEIELLLSMMEDLLF